MAKILQFIRKQPVLRELRGNYVDNKIYDLNITFYPTNVILKLFVASTEIVPLA